MHYERTRQIEQRFQIAIMLISKKKMNSKQLALELGVSQPTIQRIVSELRNRGFKIRSVRDESGWRYELVGEQKSSKTRS